MPVAIIQGDLYKMATKRISTKEKIIEAAWELFMEKGYDNTTLNEIIERAGTSKGAFYHHFRAKEDLLFRMAWFFDRNYTDWTETQDMTRNRVDLLHDYVLYSTEAVENSRYKSFLPALYGFQVMTEGNRYIMDERREYFQLMYKLLREGIQAGQIRDNRSPLDYARNIAALHRGLTYNWLLSHCQYSLVDSVDALLTPYLNSIRI